MLAANAQSGFIVRDIRVEGLQRISAGTVFNYLPVSVGSRVTAEQYPEIIRSLFKTGFFTDVSLERDGDVLVLHVTERPAIAEISISGNNDIPTDQLLERLKEVGMAQGRVFDRSLLSTVEQALIDDYFGRGKYAVKIDSDVRPLPRNRVAISLNISEGIAARIRRINIVGNTVFDDDELLDEFSQTTSGLLTIFTKTDQYSRQQLAADIEALRSYYLDRGFLKFNVDSTQVTITPDKKDIYVTINVTEGERYTIRDVNLAGELIIAEEDLRELIAISPGDTYSRSVIAATGQQLADRLGDEGYAFANIEPLPTIDEENKEISLTFVVNPGRRVYVRRINFSGNIKTQDQVLRREMRQTEGAWFSRKDVERSKTRLDRLGWLSEVNLETAPVPGSIDQIDLNYTVSELPSGSIVFGIGYGQSEGVVLNGNYRQRNFLGTGNEVSVDFNTSKSDTVYGVSYNNPYYTLDGVSRGFRIIYRETDSSENNTADYLLDQLAGQVNFGFPLNEFDTVRVGAGIEQLKVKTTDNTPQEIIDEIAENGDEYLNFKLESSWASDSRNRLIFPDRGSLNRIGLEITLPGSDAEYYKIDYRHRSYFPLTKAFTLTAQANIGYGDGYGNSDDLPFFENYYAGGLSTVRGFKANTLGPKYSDGEASGGALRVVGGGEIIMPMPFLKDSKNLRLSGFVDAGNVFETPNDFDTGELRYSAGLMIRWLSPLGPLGLSFAQPINDKSEDDLEQLQFSFGIPF